MEIVRASTTADLLALAPALVGVDTRRSLVCIPFTGTRTLPTALRVDLPLRRREKDVRELAHAVLGLLSRLRGVDGVAIVVYSDLTFDDERGVPYLEVARAMESALGRAGFRVVEAACVAPDGWERYDGVHHSEGRPLEELTSSQVVARLPPVNDDPPIEIDSAVRATVHLRLLDGDVPDGDLIELVEQALADDEWSASTAVGLLASIMRAPLRDVVLLQWAFGRSVGEQTFDDNMLWLAIQERTGESMDDLVARELEEAREAGLDDLGMRHAEMLMGRYEGLPEHARLMRALRAAQRLVACAPFEARAPALTMQAWMLWALGRGSAAWGALDRALECDPGYGLAQVLRSMLSAGMLPEWIFSAATGSVNS